MTAGNRCCAARRAIRGAGHYLWSLAVFLATITASLSEDKSPPELKLSRPHLADYNAELRGPDRRVNTDATVKRLKELGVTTFYWLVGHRATDWDDLKMFLPKAAQAGITVWAYLLPPSGNPPDFRGLCSKPFGVDYVRWSEEIARLSIAHTNLTAWVVDDFYPKHRFFTPDYLREVRAKSKAINPRLAFLTLLYFREVRQKFVEDYRGVIDGVVVAYLEDREEIERAWAIFNDATLPSASEFSLAPNARTRPGDHVMASQSVNVLPADRYEIQFLERDSVLGPTAGHHWKQLLVDGAVVWEEDAGGGTSDWRKVTVNVTEQVRGKASVTLAFRLLDKKRVSNFHLYWRVKELLTENLQLTADLSEPQKWKVSRQGAFETGFGPQKPGQRRFHIPFISMTAASSGEFAVRHGQPATPERMASQLRLSLEAWRDGKCDGVVTYCLDKRPQSQLFPLAQKLFREFARTSNPERPKP